MSDVPILVYAVREAWALIPVDAHEARSAFADAVIPGLLEEIVRPGVPLTDAESQELEMMEAIWTLHGKHSVRGGLNAYDIVDALRVVRALERLSGLRVTLDMETPDVNPCWAWVRGRSADRTSGSLADALEALADQEKP